MDRNCTKTLLVSANVGSIFEDPEKMLKMWLKEFLEAVKTLDPQFLAIHCQEVGGKNYEESMKHVNSFVKCLLAADEMQEFDRARLFLDEDFTAVDQFTALGNLYFIHRSLKNIQLYDFEEHKFVQVEGREVLSGNIANVSIMEKAKFPQEFFPDFKWSRKGFIRTRWNINNSIFDLVNIHMFHDASNIVAMESSPSAYNNNRRRTLQHTLDRFENDEYDTVPLFLFGDYNFRLDTCKLIQGLTEQSTQHTTQGKKNDISKYTYTQNHEEKVILTVEKKGFNHCEHDEVFSNDNRPWLEQFDTEPKVFSERLHELDVTFPPSYPFSEDTDDGTSYSKTRCPGWCDRIMFTPSARTLMHTEEGPPEYTMIGRNICMGDHKPVCLNMMLRHNTGNHSTDTAVSDESSESPQHQPLKKVISINGEEVQVSSLDDINIHDFASFEQEEVITRKFMSTIKRKEGGFNSKASFKNVVRDVMTSERIIKAMKHYSHRSDSEISDTEDESATCRSIHSEDDTGNGESMKSPEKKSDINANVGSKEETAMTINAATSDKVKFNENENIVDTIDYKIDNNDNNPDINSSPINNNNNIDLASNQVLLKTNQALSLNSSVDSTAIFNNNNKSSINVVDVHNNENNNPEPTTAELGKQIQSDVVMPQEEDRLLKAEDVQVTLSQSQNEPNAEMKKQEPSVNRSTSRKCLGCCVIL